MGEINLDYHEDPELLLHKWVWENYVTQDIQLGISRWF